MKDGAIAIIAVLAFFIGIYLGWNLGQKQGAEQAQQAAIKAGVARYTVDPATGITKFEYVKP